MNLAPSNFNPATIYGGWGQTIVNANGSIKPLIVGGTVQPENFTTIPAISWATPDAVTYGTALSNTQLDATTNVPGTFAYSPAIGTVLAAGDQSLNVTFTPTDTADYTIAKASVVLHVDRATSTTTATDAGGTYSGSPFPATAEVKGAGGLDDTNLADFTFSYVGTGSTVYAASSTAPTNAGTYTVTATYNGDANHTSSSSCAVAFSITAATPTIAVVDAGGTYNGSPFPATNATVTGVKADGILASFGSSTLSYLYYQGTTLLASAPSVVGSYSVVSHFTSNNSNYTNADSAPAGFTISLPAQIIVLNGTANGALTLSGSASINAPGAIVVDSSSKTALVACGNAKVKATAIDVVGGFSSSGNATISPAPATGHSAVSDPLAGLVAPTAETPMGAVSLGGNSSQTINPGDYTQISVSGNARLTMNPGTYIITGGGFSVSGNASVTGSGVMIYNAGSTFPNAGGTFGYINLSGAGTISLTPETSAPYAGVAIFQSRDNAQGLTLSGNAMSGMSGAVYAPDAATTISGNATMNLLLIVNTLTLSGNAVFNDVAAQPAAGNSATVFTPAQVRTAYGLDNVAADGTGQTIAIVDAYDDPAIFNALDTFDSQFGLTASGPTLSQQYGAAASFLTVLNQSGQASPLPAVDPAGAGGDNWEVEEALDVEWAHAAAPGARIVLVEANSQSIGDLMASVATAADLPGVSVVSMSWGFEESQSVLAADEAMYDGYLTTTAGHQGVTFVASTGDYGAAVPEYPAMSPNVVAVGGTSLTLNADNSYQSETGWGSLDAASGMFYGTGGGVSLFEQEPAYQQGVQTIGNRTTPDVSFVADPNTGAWVADTYNLDSSNPWEVVGGTSLSAPAWAGLIAVANQLRVASGSSTLGSATANEAQQALYSMPASDYHDVISGSNGYAAGAGYDLVTGLGSPVTDKLVPDLAAYTAADPIVVASSPLTAASAVLTGGAGNGTSNAVLSVANALRIFAAELVTPGNVVSQPAAPAGALSDTVISSLGEASGDVHGAEFSSNVGLSGISPVIDLIDLALRVGDLAPAVVMQTSVSREIVDRSFDDGEFLAALREAISSPSSELLTGAPSALPGARRVQQLLDALFGRLLE